MKSSFVHLHTHSHYSLLDGLAKVDDLVKAAVKYEMPALAITEHGNMYSAIEFYKKCKKAGIKPIIGVEFYTAYESLHQKRPNIDNKRSHLILLAKNLAGYKNLMELVTISNLEGYYYKPRIDRDVLRKHSDGLIGLTACMGGEIPRLIRNKKNKEAEKLAKEYEEILGKGNLYLEVQYHPNLEHHQETQRGLIELSQKTGIPLAATHDVHYIKKEDNIAQDALVAVGRKETISEAGRQTNVQEDFSFLSPEEMAKNFKDTPSAVENTVKIADMCDLELKLGEWFFPKIDLPEGMTAEEQLKKLVDEGYEKVFSEEIIKKRGESEKVLKERMEYELKVINEKGYAPYFLEVAEIVNWARKQKIVNNTRGSAAGSFVSYLLGITSVDPIKFVLPFERFLNPFRPSPPDIDMDFADDRREEVIDHIKEISGVDHVAQIGTFGTMMARGSVRDVARVLGKPYELGDRVSKLIPLGAQGFPMTIDRALEETPELKTMYEKEKEVKEIIDMAKQIEGSARHISVHAAGVVVSPTKLTDFIPLQRETNGDKIITQYDMHAVEDAGLLKLDILGIKNLAILGNAVKIVHKIYGIEIDLDNLPEEDEKTFKMLSRGETTGVFQLGGNGMTKWLKELKPTKITDLMAMIALFRPGPMENIPEFIKRKNGEEPVTYLDERLEKILKDTYGVLTYQDDVMLLAIEVAGYTWETVDAFRKAIGKKIPKIMAKQEKVFIEGCQEFGKINLRTAEKLWKLLDPFKGYGFGRAHAASYSQVAYQTAYMKANYPAEFMTALLTADAGDTDKISVGIHECKKMGIPVLPPDVNASFGDFAVIKGTEAKNLTEKADAIRDTSSAKDEVRFGLYTIKNLGHEIAGAIIDERKTGGKYKSFSDFLDRVKHKNLNKKSLEALVKAGAMDELGERGQLLTNIDDALLYSRQAAKTGQGQNSLFALMEDQSSVPILRLKEAPPASQEEKLLWEKELLGLYISGHPLDSLKDKLKKLKVDIAGSKQMEQGMPVVIGGMVEDVRKITTKKGDPMMFVKVSDYKATVEIVVFPRVLEDYESKIYEGNCIAVKGRISIRNGETTIIAEQIKEMKE